MVNPGWELHATHFGPERLEHCLAACDGDDVKAAALYDWNARISAAFWESLGHLEVALRNAIDRQMRVTHLRKGRDGHWIFDEAHELGRDALGQGRHRHPYRDVATAIGRVHGNHKPAVPGQIISELPFGFWHQLVSRRQLALWPDLVAAFPHVHNRSQRTVHDPIASLRALRNRIGHHHRIWAIDLRGKYAELITLAEFIDPSLAVWIDSTSQVRDLIAARP